MKNYFFGVFKAQPGEIMGLNGIRAIAYFMLIYAHFFRAYYELGLKTESNLLDNFLNNGSLCMDAFFVLSGFLVGGQLIREQFKTGQVSLGKFFIKRVFRIFPPYFIFLGIQYALMGQMIHSMEPEMAAQLAEVRSRILWDFVYMTDYIPGTMIHGWSLSVEEKFYLMLPLVVVGLGFVKSIPARLSILTFLFCIPLVVKVSLFYILGYDNSDLNFGDYTRYFYYPFHGRMDSLFLGVLFGAIYNYKPKSVLQYLNNKNSSFIAGAGISVLLLLMFFTTEGYPGTDGPEPSFFVAVFRTLIAAIAWLSIMVLCFKENSIINRFLSLSVFVPVARLSYCAYIIHLLFLGVFTKKLVGYEPVSHGQILLWTIPLGLMILGVAYIYYLMAERPFLLLKEKLTGKKPAVEKLEAS